MEAKAIIDAVLDFDQEKTAQLVRAHLDQGENALNILDQALIAAMDEVGRKFSAGVFFVPEMLMAAEAMRAGLEVLRPHLARSDIKAKGTIIIGTVKGDVHDIGKNLVKMMLEGAGFETIDLGTDVKPDGFVTAVREHQPQLLGMSALLTTTMPGMKATIEALQEAGLRDTVKIMIGGAPVTAAFAEQIGADAYAPDAATAVDVARGLVA